jgi:hypothetical protein
MKDGSPEKIITAHELKNPNLEPFNLDKGDHINILEYQARYGMKATKVYVELLLKNKALQANIDLQIKRENAKINLEIKKQESRIAQAKEKLKIKENQRVRDSLLQQEKEKNRLTVKLADNQTKIAVNKAKNDRLTITDPIKQQEKTKRTQARAENADKIGAGIGNSIAGIGKGAGAVFGGIAGGIAGNPFGVAQSGLNLASTIGEIKKNKQATNLNPNIAVAKELKNLIKTKDYNIKDIKTRTKPQTPKETPATPSKSTTNKAL